LTVLRVFVLLMGIIHRYQKTAWELIIKTHFLVPEKKTEKEDFLHLTYSGFRCIIFWGTRKHNFLVQAIQKVDSVNYFSFFLERKVNKRKTGGSTQWPDLQNPSPFLFEKKRYKSKWRVNSVTRPSVEPLKEKKSGEGQLSDPTFSQVKRW
jgi:hypothetical protein